MYGVCGYNTNVLMKHQKCYVVLENKFYALELNNYYR